MNTKKVGVFLTAMSLFLGFSSIGAADIKSFSLINANTDRSIRPLRQGSTVSLNKLPTSSLSIRANTRPYKTGSVVFTLDGKKVNTDSYPPYAISKEWAGNFQPISLSPGRHTLSATEYSRRNAQGKRGNTHKISFTVNGSSSTQTARAKALPDFSKWEEQMIKYGKIHCATLQNPGVSQDAKLDATYYDAEWIYYQIADYTGDKSWYACAKAAEAVYRDKYAFANNGLIYGHWIFTHGLFEDYMRTGDERSKQALSLISHNAYFARDITNHVSTEGAVASREVAYAVMAFLHDEELGAPRRDRFSLLVNDMFGHYKQIFDDPNAKDIRSFVVGLTAHAMISLYEKNKDSRVIPALRKALDMTWDRSWIPQAQAMMYSWRGDESPAPDLNMLIATAYEWVYHKTGEVRFRERGDALFQGSVKGAWLAGAKQFNQSYRWAFEYVRLRKAKP